MIPKVIHYCWFGKNGKPDMFQKCVSSWKKFCPDFKIIEWNEDNFDVHICPYVSEAYSRGKWAFVSDYARLWIIYKYGGVYLDTDVEMVRSIEPLLENKAFFGYENIGLETDGKYINTGLGFGAEPANSIVGEMLKEYENTHFIKANGDLDLTPCPIRNTAAVDFIIRNHNPNDVLFSEEATFYPAEYFCPMDARGLSIRKTVNTYTIHWYSASWLSEDQQIVHQYRLLKARTQRLFGDRLGSILVRLLYLLRPDKRKVLKRM